MSQPQWITPAGSLGTIAEGVFYQLSVQAESPGNQVFFRLIAGQLPEGIQVTDSGIIEGTPETVERVQGVPLEVNRDVTSRFAIRAYTRRLVNGQFVVDRLADRTFTLTITGQDIPQFVTPAGSIGTYYDGNEVSIQLLFTDNDIDDPVITRLASGTLPPGLTLDQQGRISGAIQPLIGPPTTAAPGEDATPWDFYPWDFRTRAQSQNFQFAVEITDGKQSNVRSFEIYVYAKDDMTADTVNFTADNTFVTADVTPLRTPVIITPTGSIGTTRYDNFFAFQFQALDFDGDTIEFQLSAGPGAGYDPDLSGFDADGSLYDQGSFTPPSALGLLFDNDTGWLTGYIPDLGAVEQTYPFALRVRKRDFPIYVSAYYFYSLTVIADIDTEVTWLTPAYLGTIDNGAVSMFYVAAVSPLGVALTYRIPSGSNSRLPQGLTLLPSGNIVGRASFNTFALDSGATTFDVNLNSRLGIDETTFDMLFTFTVNAYAPSSEQIYYRLSGVTVTDGGSNYRPTQLAGITIPVGQGGDLYDPMDPPTVTIEPPPNIPGNIPAVAGAVTIVGGAITAIALANPGLGYSSPPEITITSNVGTGARAVATVYQISIEIDAPPPVVGSERATATARVSNGVITSIPVVSGGANYVSQPTVSILGSAATAAVVSGVTLTNGSVTAVNLASGGSGYVGTPTVSIFGGGDNDDPNFQPAVLGTPVIEDGVITAILIGNPGSGYTQTPAITITGGGGSGATAVCEIVEYQREFAVSIFREFQIRLVRRWNEPYETLYIQAMPGLEDRARIQDLVSNTDIIPDSAIYRADDPNFGRSTSVVYNHAYGLAAASLDLYVESLDLNHYWRNLTLGPVQTAVARDSQGEIVYEVVYSQIIDDLVNNEGVSVSKSVNLPYPVQRGIETITTVYPNSLDNMRDQVIDTVGQVTPALPLWMLSKQENQQVLGFRPAWVIAYVRPGLGKRVAYDIGRNLGFRLNIIDFNVDRYELDRSQTLNWNPNTDRWIPSPPTSTTFDRNSQFRYLIPELNIPGRVDSLSTQYGFGTETRFSVTPSALGAVLVVQVNGVTQRYFSEIGQAWTGDGSTTEFVFNGFNAAATPISVSVANVVQVLGVDYTLSGNVIDFTTPPDNGDPIAARQILGDFYLTYGVGQISVDLLSAPPSNTTTYTGDDIETEFSYTPISNRGLFVYVDNVLQVLGTDYTVETSKILFVTAPDSGDSIRIVQPSQIDIYQILDIWVMDPNSAYQTATTFDFSSTTFNAPADRWVATNEFDKYLVFPKRTILG